MIVEHLLLDPALVIPQKNLENSAVQLTVFWKRLFDWAGDSRCRLGQKTREALFEMHARNVVADECWVPRYLQADVRKVLGKILARPALEHSISGAEVGLFPAYLCGPTHQSIMIDDILGCINEMCVAVASDDAHWAGAVNSVRCVPPPPDSVMLHFAPHQPSEEERRRAYSNFYSNTRIIIYGGQGDLAVVKLLELECGISPKKIKWVPCERNKKPSNIQAEVKGLASCPGAVVLCITGKVGHSTSDKVESACKASSVDYVPVEFASGIVGELARRATAGVTS